MNLIQSTSDDVPRIMPCARQFCAVLGIALNEDWYERFWRHQIELGTGAIFLVVDDTGFVAGGIGGIAGRLDLTGELELIEKFWFMDENHRSGLWSIKLLKSLESWGRVMHCRHISMICMEDSMRATLEVFYGRLAYRRFETVYRKPLPS
jgi:hypothetical protein